MLCTALQCDKQHFFFLASHLDFSNTRFISKTEVIGINIIMDE